jgi:DNA-binding winged helix-turn-helix (wHTH) protein
MPEPLQLFPWMTDFLGRVIVNLANEAVPIAAISRSIEQSSDDVREILATAISLGEIIELPAPDWPPSARRQDRLNVLATREKIEAKVQTCQRVLKLTKLEASFFVVLLSHDEVSKDVLHHVIEAQRASRNNITTTDPKMVDVIICKLRKKLSDKGVPICTIWGHGYYITNEAKAAAANLLIAGAAAGVPNTTH